MNFKISESDNFYLEKKLSIVDWMVFTLALLLLLAGISLYLKNPFKIVPLRQLVGIGKLKTNENDVSRKLPSTLNWMQVSPDDVLYNGDQILTLEDSSAVVEFIDKSELVIGPQSLIRLEINNDEFTIEMIKGKLEFKKAPGSKIKVVEKSTGKVIPITENTTIATEKSVVKEEVIAEVAPEIPIKEPIIEEPKIEAPPLEAPRIIAQQILEFTGDDDDITYKVKMKRHPQAKRYYLEVYSDEKLTHPVLKVSTTKNEYEWNSNHSGKYYYRVRVKDSEGNMSPYSKTGALLFPISPLEDL